METTCKHCGKTIRTYPSSPHSYCSKECKTLDKTKEVTCRNCGKSSRVPKSLADRPYCSRKCMNVYEKVNGRGSYGRRARYVIKDCKTCGKSFEILESKASRRHHCSKSCRSKDPEIVSKLYRAVELATRCAYCGNAVIRLLSHVKPKTSHVFCNILCFGKYKKENVESINSLMEYRRKAGTLPNKLELSIANEFPELVYVGDGKIWIKTKNGRKCPDFVIPDRRKVLEIWGDYWHKGEDAEEMNALYKDAGYECLVVWESEIRSDRERTMNRINTFIKG